MHRRRFQRAARATLGPAALAATARVATARVATALVPVAVGLLIGCSGSEPPAGNATGTTVNTTPGANGGSTGATTTDGTQMGADQTTGTGGDQTTGTTTTVATGGGSTVNQTTTTGGTTTTGTGTTAGMMGSGGAVATSANMGGGGSAQGGATATMGGATAGGASQGGATSMGGATVGGAGQGGDEWWFNGPRPAPATGSWPPPAIQLTEVSSATQPTAIAAPRGDTSRIYFAEKWGVIRLIKDGVLQPEPALDMRDAVLEGGPLGGGEEPNQGKRGLVGLAIHPNFEDNGRIFVMYTADQGEQGVYGTGGNNQDDGDMTFAEYRRSADNPDVFEPEPVDVFLQFDKGNCSQCSQHNGGSLEIGVDGFLWASTGDPPPYDNPGSQDLMNLNGKLLRFDISGDAVTAAGNYPGADPYIWSIGIRNAYKFSIDRYTGDVYVADVGENSWEELSVEPYGEGNRDHGWPKREGNHNYQAMSCGADNCIDPIFEYSHTGEEGVVGADNCIIGGYVYRGQAIPELQGTYIYSDFGSGKVRALQVQDGAMVNGPHEFAGLSVFAGCFGEDAAGEMYVCDYETGGGRILRIDAQ